MKKILQNLNHLLPNYCLTCLTPTHSSLALCTTCITQLPFYTQQHCKICANQLTLENAICGKCLKSPPPFHETIAIFHYKEPIKSFIHELKFNKKLIYAHILGTIAAQQIIKMNSTIPEVIIPVPLNTKRIIMRGYNQAQEIANHLAKSLKISSNSSFLKRIKNTKSQATLNAGARINNLDEAFFIKKNIPSKHIAIIDDVMTTGATLKQLCKTIINKQLCKISIWCIARANSP